jgi:hypothetical protein
MQAWAVDTGMLSQEEYDRFKERYPRYVPTKRFISSTGGKQGGAGSSFKLAVGGEQEIINPFDSFMENMASIVGRASKNAVGQAFDALYQKNDGLGIFAREMAAGGGTIPNTLEVTRKDGSTVQYEIFDKGLMNMFEGMNARQAGDSLKALRSATQMMSQLTTGMNPVFGVKNALRDFQTSVNTGTWAKSYVDGAVTWARSFYRVWKNKGNYEDYLAQGGGGWNRVRTTDSRSTKAYRQALLPGYGTDTIGGKLSYAGKKLWSGITLSRLNEIIEQTSRFAEYEFGDHDKSDVEGRQEAFQAAQDATVDFSKRGAGQYMSVLKAVTPFMNANLQGSNKTINMVGDVKTNPAPFVKTVVNTALTAVLANALRGMFGDDEDKDAYGYLTEEMKNQNIIIPNPFSDDRRFIRLPVAQDALARAVHGVVTQALDSGDPYTDGFMSELGTIAASIIEDANPLQTTIFSSLIDVQRNVNWYGSPIVATSLKNLPVTEQYDDTTPQMFKDASRLTDVIPVLPAVSPKGLQYLFDQNMGFIGDMLIPALSRDKNTGELGGVSAVIKSFANGLTIDPAYTNDITDAYYDELSLLDGTIQSYNKNRPLDALRGDLTEAQIKAAYTEAYEMTHDGGILDAASDRIADLWGEVEKARTSPGLSKSQQAVLARDTRMKIVREELAAIEAVEDWKAKYADGRSAIGFALFGGAASMKPTKLETMDDIFKTDLNAGADYMKRSEQAMEEAISDTERNAAVPHPLRKYKADKTEVTIPDADWNEYVDVYRSAYADYLEGVAGWDTLMNSERLDAARAAHTKAHAAAKKWYEGIR